MAAAVGPDGWLRRPPQHQRMHPVDVLVDGVLAALDGQVRVEARLPRVDCAKGDALTFTRVPLSDDFMEPGVTLDSVRRRLKPVVDRLLWEALDTQAKEVTVEVRHAVQAVALPSAPTLACEHMA